MVPEDFKRFQHAFRMVPEKFYKAFKCFNEVSGVSRGGPHYFRAFRREFRRSCENPLKIETMPS